jgi:hypothetical protein
VPEPYRSRNGILHEKIVATRQFIAERMSRLVAVRRQQLDELPDLANDPQKVFVIGIFRLVRGPNLTGV